MVAVHNDYRLNGEAMTFWLLTHPDGRWVKGEGKTDAEALNQIRASLTTRNQKELCKCGSGSFLCTVCDPDLQKAMMDADRAPESQLGCPDGCYPNELCAECSANPSQMTPKGGE